MRDLGYIEGKIFWLNFGRQEANWAPPWTYGPSWSGC